MHQDHCPQCGGPLECLSGASAHPDNWYCADEKNCGWRAWEARAAKLKPVESPMAKATPSVRNGMSKRTKGMTVTYWHNGNKVRKYHDDAVRMGCRFYTGEQFDVLFNSDAQVIATYKNGSVIGVQDHTQVPEEGARDEAQ